MKGVYDKMNSLTKDKINGAVILVLALFCLLVGGYSATKQQVIETICMMGVSNILFMCGTVVISRYKIEKRISDGFSIIEKRLDKLQGKGDTQYIKNKWVGE